MPGISNVSPPNYVYTHMTMTVRVGCDGLLGAAVLIREGHEAHIEIYELCGSFETNTSKVIESKTVAWDLQERWEQLNRRTAPFDDAISFRCAAEFLHLYLGCLSDYLARLTD